MDGVAILRANLADAHWILERTIEGTSPEHVQWIPPGTANSIAATYAHVVASEDDLIQVTFRGQRTLATGAWAGKNGISLHVPARGSDWYAWGRRVQVDLPATRRYAEAVYAATDEYLATLRPDQVGQIPDVPLPGNQTLNWIVHNLLIQHAGLHTGEIAVLKGLQGIQGYA